MHFPFDNSYARLPEHFYSREQPVPVPAPELIQVNEPLAEALGIDLSGADAGALAAVFSGNQMPEGAEPLAQAYAGHQFGGFVPQLGDGRAHLLGEVVDQTGVRRDIQLKGSGRTSFSRGGDGRAPLGPVLREYVVSEAMHALGVPTTRALAAVTTGESLFRQGAEPGAVLTRVAASHVRVGTVQYFAARGDGEAVQALIDYVIDRHYPELRESVPEREARTMALFSAICERQAWLVSRWMSLGFIHGVMNTDNTSISGETIDYGPCAFMEAYHPATRFSAIDEGGRYAYGNQPDIAQWNLARLAEGLLTTMEDSEQWIPEAQNALRLYRESYEQHWLAAMRAKLGLLAEPAEDAADRALVESLLDTMADMKADFTLTFRRLGDAIHGDVPVTEVFDLSPDEAADAAVLNEWLARWRQRLARQGESAATVRQRMQSTNPGVIPRNHRVAAAIQDAEAGDFTTFYQLLAAVQSPWEDNEYSTPAAGSEQVMRTFCGT